MSASPEWFHAARRWLQITLRENEATTLQPRQWAETFARLALDGVTLNAGGYIATYPTRLPLHFRPDSFGNKDPFGDLVKAAREAGLRVVARFDPSRAVPEVYYGRPDWFFLGADDQPRRAADRYGAYYTCLNTQYFWEQIPNMFGEVMERYDVDGFLGDEWRGYGAGSLGEVCHCAACRERFRLQRGADLPAANDPADPAFQAWAEWRRQCERDIQAHWNDTLKLFKRGITFLGATPAADAANFLDLADATFTPSPGPDAPAWEIAANGRLLRALDPDGEGGRRFQRVETTAYGSRLSRSEGALTLDLAETVATGCVPCAHVPTAVPEDRRALAVVERFNEWRSRHEDDLLDPTRHSAATVAVLVATHPGAREASRDHERGMMAALTRAGIAFDLLPDTLISRTRLLPYRALALPSLARLSVEQCDLLWEFGSDGGGIVATFETSVLDEHGAPRGDFGMTQRLGVKLMRPAPIGPLGPESYFRVRESHPALDDPALGGAFADTALLAGGGRYLAVELLMDHKTPLSIVPPAPLEPTEAAWTFAAGTIAPALVLGPSGKGRVAYFPAEPDALFWRHGHPDHANMVAAAVRWAHRDPLPVEVSGGAVDVHPYTSGDDLIVHLVNLTGAGVRDRRPDPIPTSGPRTLTVRTGGPYRHAELLVSGETVEAPHADGVTTVTISKLAAHEVVALRA